MQNTDAMALARKKILVEMLANDAELKLETITGMLVRIKEIYEQAEHSAASYLNNYKEKF
jgi:hypothetical protein